MMWMKQFRTAEVERFIHYSNTYFDYRQISLKPIRDRQDISYADAILAKADGLLEEGETHVKEPFFFVGSVDFMVKNSGGEKTFYILETNGGSSRGFAILPEERWLDAYSGYLEALDFAADEPLVLLSHPNRDLLVYEKVFLAEAFRSRLEEAGFKGTRITPVSGFSDRPLKGASVVIGAYADILPHLSLEKRTAVLRGQPVSLLIGDGLVRRHPGLSEHLKDKDLKTVVINEVFHLTDDKGLTYFALAKAESIMERFSVAPLNYWRAHDENELQRLGQQALSEMSDAVIKPHGGSGGTGIEIITRPKSLTSQIKRSLEHYKKKFGPRRSPFPYTVCERVKASPAVWKGEKHQFDIRVYVARLGGRIKPLGALARIALEPFTGDCTKRSFVVNLSGYGGVDTDRGLGISRQTLELLSLEQEDFAAMYAASASLMAYITNNFPQLREEARSL